MNPVWAVLSPLLILGSSALLAIKASSREAEVSTFRRAYFVFKPLTIILIILYAIFAVNGFADRRGSLIVLGLFMSLLGDVALMFPKRFLLGLAAFLTAHLCYLTAFLTGVTSFGLLIALLPLSLFAALVLSLIWSGIDEIKLAVAFYLFVIVAMAYQASERYLAFYDLASLSALIGTLLFVLSDSLLALNRFRKPLIFANAAILLSYYLAQWFIAFSLHLRAH